MAIAFTKELRAFIESDRSTFFTRKVGVSIGSTMVLCGGSAAASENDRLSLSLVCFGVGFWFGLCVIPRASIWFHLLQRPDGDVSDGCCP
jgi:hypothetical protein